MVARVETRVAVGGQPAEWVVAWLAGAQFVEVLKKVVVDVSQTVDCVPIGLPGDPDIQQRGARVAPLPAGGAAGWTKYLFCCTVHSECPDVRPACTSGSPVGATSAKQFQGLPDA